MAKNFSGTLIRLNRQSKKYDGWRDQAFYIQGDSTRFCLSNHLNTSEKN